MFSRPQVVACLSEMVRNDSVSQSLSSRFGNNPSSQHRVSQPCRQQLRNQLFQQHEDIQFNPNVRKPCASDEKRFCSQVKPGQGRILQCLKAHRKQLEDVCHAAIFQVEREEMDDSGVDYQLVQLCKEPIKRLCQNDVGKALDCLKVAFFLLSLKTVSFNLNKLYDRFTWRRTRWMIIVNK